MKEQPQMNDGSHAEGRSELSDRLGYVNWNVVRNRLITVAAERFEISERMTVYDIEIELRKINGDPSVIDALEWLEHQKTLSVGLAQRQESCGSQGNLHQSSFVSPNVKLRGGALLRRPSRT